MSISITMRLVGLILSIFLLAACSRNGSLVPKTPGEDIHLPELNLALSTDEDVVLSTNLLAEYGISSSEVSLALVQNLSQGTLTLGADGALVFTPPLEYSGNQDIEIEFFYKSKSLGKKTVVISTLNVDDAPVAVDGSLNTVEDTVSVSGTLVATDVDSLGLQYSVYAQGTKGTVVITDDATGAFEYLPLADAFGVDTFSFRAFDGNSYSNVATITVNISPVNDAPISHDFTLNVFEAVTKSFDLDGFDIDGDVLTYTIITPPTKGVLVCVGKSCDYTSFADEEDDVFEYEVSDGVLSSSSIVTIDIAPVNDAPVSSNMSFSTNEDTVYNGQIPGSDNDGPSLSFVLVSGPSHGSLNLNTATGTFDYTPDADYYGADSFTYKVSDGLLETSVYTASITVVPVDDAPVANNQNVTLEQNEVKEIILVATDVDTPVLTYSIASAPSHGAVVCVDEVCEYTPDFMYVGNDSFVFEVSDGTTQVQRTVSLTISDLDNWWDPQWHRRRKIPINNAFSAETNHVLLITLDSTFNYGDAKIDGSDIRVTSSSGTLLASFVDSWNLSGTSKIFVRATVLPTSTSDYLWLYYKNPAASSADNSSTFGDAIFRTSMNPSALADDVGSSDLVSTGTSSATGLVGTATEFQTGDSIEIKTPSAVASISGAFSFEGVLKESTRTSSSVIFHKNNEFKVSSENGRIRFQVRNDAVETADAIDLNSFVLVTAVFDGSLCKIYIDAVEKASGACSLSPQGTNTSVYLGNNASGTETFIGIMDEVRIWDHALALGSVEIRYRSIVGAMTTIASEQAKGQPRINHVLMTIDADGNDGYIDASLHSSGTDGVNSMGDDGADYVWAYNRFQLPQALPSNAVISKATLSVLAVSSTNWNPAANYLLVVADKTADAAQVSMATDYPEGATGANETLNQILWGHPALSWEQGFRSSDDISSIVQELVDDNAGLASGNHIQLWTRGAYGFNGVVKTLDYSSTQKVPANLLIEWTQ